MPIGRTAVWCDFSSALGQSLAVSSSQRVGRSWAAAGVEISSSRPRTARRMTEPPGQKDGPPQAIRGGTGGRNGARAQTRTGGLLFRRRMLYPPELHAHAVWQGLVYQLLLRHVLAFVAWKPMLVFGLACTARYACHATFPLVFPFQARELRLRLNACSSMSDDNRVDSTRGSTCAFQPRHGRRRDHSAEAGS